MDMTENDEKRFWSKALTHDENGCMLWTGTKNRQGYGVFSVGAKGRQFNSQAHRVAYKLLVGPIPDGLVLDHVKARGCRNRHCVAVDHLEAVTQAENVRRGDTGKNNTEKTHCPHGHLYDEANTYLYRGKRFCRACRRRHRLRRRAAARAARGRRRLAQVELQQ
jgi:hypothetical protein